MIENRQDLEIKGKWMNAAGTLGYAPPAQWPLPEPPAAFVTNPISYQQRTPARDRMIRNFPGGFLLHTGLPSAGFRIILRNYSQRWARSSVPIWAHLLGDSADHVVQMVRQMEDIEGIQAVELSFSHHTKAADILDIVKRSVGELPVVLSIPIDRIHEEWLSQVSQLGVSAFSLAAPRGLLFNETGQRVQGRTFGPALLPLAAEALEYLKEYNVPVIAGCGVMTQNDIDWLIELGAIAVQLDFVLWRGWQVDIQV